MKHQKDEFKCESDSHDNSLLVHDNIEKLTTATTLADKLSSKKGQSYSPLSKDLETLQEMNAQGPENLENVSNKSNSKHCNIPDPNMSDMNDQVDLIFPKSELSEDLARMIEEIKKPGDLQTAMDAFVLHNTKIDKAALLKSENLKIKRYKDCIYFGEAFNGNKHGKGVMIYINGRVYEGEWENEVKHGYGLEISPNGNYYEGYFLNNKPEGLGTFFWRNGESYKGEWRHGLKHGSGMWTGTKEDSYVGEWKSGKPDGYGVHLWRNGDRYEGEFMSSLKHGHGTEKFANGDVFMGNYENGKPNGFGEYHWKNESSYKGFFKNGLRHGKGVWRKNFGKTDIYDGDWINDKKSGVGVYTWVSGNCYKGAYFDDLRHGYGEMFWIDGSSYKGNWRRGEQHGEGTMYIPGRSVQQGLFKHNIFTGDINQKDGSLPRLGSASIKSQDVQNPLSDQQKRVASLNGSSLHYNPKISSKFDIDVHNKSRRGEPATFRPPTRDTNRSVNIDVSGPDLHGGQDYLNQTVDYNAKNPRGRQYSNITPKKRVVEVKPLNLNDHASLKKKLADQILKDLEQYPLNILKASTRDQGTQFTTTSTNQQHAPFQSQHTNPQNMEQRHNYKKYSISPPREISYRISPQEKGIPDKLPNIKPLDTKEAIRWNHRKDQMPYFERKRFIDSRNPQTVLMIRELINPPVWRYWPKHSILAGRSDVPPQATIMSTSPNFYKKGS